MDQSAEEARKLARSKDLLDFKRVNWRAITRHQIRQEFERALVKARTEGFGFRLLLNEYEQPNEGTIQIASIPCPTGAVNRKSSFSFGTGDWEHQDAAVVEDGGALVATQSVRGDIHFAIYPRKSERIQPTYKEILLFAPLDPTQVTRPIIKKAIREYLFVLRATSLHGSHALGGWDRVRLVRLRANDWRARNRVIRAIFSAQSLMGGVGVILTWLAKNYLTPH